MKKPAAVEVSPTTILETLTKFNLGFKHLRKYINEMTDEQLVELYNQAKELGNISWLMRCMAIGVAKSRVGWGDVTKVMASIANTFGIGIRMAQLDVQVYETFIKDNPDFEPELPANFYQIAAISSNPKVALQMALEKRAEIPSFPASAFRAMLKGEINKEAAPKGTFMLVPVDTPLDIVKEEKRLDGEGCTQLYGRIKLYSIGGNLYTEIL